MQPYKRLGKGATFALFAAGLMATGGVVSIGMQAFAQTPSTSSASVTATQTQDSADDSVADQEGNEHHGGGKRHGHAPMGNDGIVASINGTTIIMTEEADEGGASYTIDASSSTVIKDGTASTLSSIAVGDKIFVKGTVNGTSVTATSIADGHRGRWGK